MNKKLAAVLLAGALLFGAAPLQAQESSSIDAVTAGVADTGRADKEAEKKITASTVPYSVAVLPYIDQSGMDEKGRKVAANAIKDALKEKYPPAKKGGVPLPVPKLLLRRCRTIRLKTLTRRYWQSLLPLVKSWASTV